MEYTQPTSGSQSTARWTEAITKERVLMGTAMIVAAVSAILLVGAFLVALNIGGMNAAIGIPSSLGVSAATYLTIEMSTIALGGSVVYIVITLLRFPKKSEQPDQGTAESRDQTHSPSAGEGDQEGPGSSSKTAYPIRHAQRSPFEYRPGGAACQQRNCIEPVSFYSEWGEERSDPAILPLDETPLSFEAILDKRGDQSDVDASSEGEEEPKKKVDSLKPKERPHLSKRRERRRVKGPPEIATTKRSHLKDSKAMTSPNSKPGSSSELFDPLLSPTIGDDQHELFNEDEVGPSSTVATSSQQKGPHVQKRGRNRKK